MLLLDETHASLRQVARDFTDREIIPIANAYDRAGKDVPDDLIRKMAEMGYAGLILPEEYGGAGSDCLSLAIVTEETCRGWLSAGSILLGRNSMCGHIVLRNGTEAQKRDLLPRIARGEVIISWAGTEPEAGSDAAGIQTRAVRQGDRYVINGAKMFCTLADRADLMFLFVRTDPAASPRHKGISCILWEKEKGLPAPYITGSKIDLVGYRGVNTFSLIIEDLSVPASSLLGGVENRGFYQMMDAYEIGRIQVASRAVGLAQAAFEDALKYAKERCQFGKPICQFQAIRMKLADMAAEIEAARQLTWNAASMKDAGHRADLQASLAKLVATEMAERVTSEAIQIHGGYGYSTEFSVQRYWRDAKLMKLGEGTSDIQREIIARRLLGE